MNENDPLEERLQSWIPRRPSPKIQKRLFGERAVAAAPSHVWNWLAPAAACALTLLVAVKGSGHRAGDLEDRSTFPAVSALNYDPEACNTLRSFVFSRMDIDVNFWPHIESSPLPPAAPRKAIGPTNS